MIPKAQATKEKLDKSHFIKIKMFCTSKDTMKKEKRQQIKWEKIFVNHVLVSDLYVEYIKNS